MHSVTVVSWLFLVTNFTLLAFSVIFCPNLSFFEKVTMYFVTDIDTGRTEFCFMDIYTYSDLNFGLPNDISGS